MYYNFNHSYRRHPTQSEAFASGKTLSLGPDTEHAKYLRSFSWKERSWGNSKPRPSLSAINFTEEPARTLIMDAVQDGFASTVMEGTRPPLQYTDLGGSNLSRLILQKANLESAFLENATLIKTDFRRANFSGATLHNANASNATMIDTMFYNANLIKTVMRYASLEQADFRLALMEGVDISGANLTGAKGMEYVEYDLQQPDLLDSNLRMRYNIAAQMRRFIIYCKDEPPTGLVEAFGTDEVRKTPMALTRSEYNNLEGFRKTGESTFDAELKRLRTICDERGIQMAGRGYREDR